MDGLQLAAFAIVLIVPDSVTNGLLKCKSKVLLRFIFTRARTLFCKWDAEPLLVVGLGFGEKGNMYMLRETENLN